MTREIARDMERKVGTTMKEAFLRELNMAERVLEPAEVMMIMLLVSKGTVASTAATIAGMAAPEDRESVYNMALDQVVALVRADWPNAKREIEAGRAKSGAAR